MWLLTDQLTDKPTDWLAGLLTEWSVQTAVTLLMLWHWFSCCSSFFNREMLPKLEQGLWHPHLVNLLPHPLLLCKPLPLLPQGKMPSVGLQMHYSVRSTRQAWILLQVHVLSLSNLCEFPVTSEWSLYVPSKLQLSSPGNEWTHKIILNVTPSISGKLR